jgi:hypothetical protein
MDLYGTGMCPVDGDVLACLRSRATGKIVFFCPICGLSFREPPPEWEVSEDIRLNDLAPTGVGLPSREEVDAAHLASIKALDATWMKWIEDVLWRPPLAGQTDEEATRWLFDRWYCGERLEGRPERRTSDC